MANPKQEAATVAWLTEAIADATKSAKFCTAGRFPESDPGLHVEGIGSVLFPMNRKTEMAMLKVGKVAPYGKGTQTLVNQKVRKTLEVNPRQFSLGAKWETAVSSLMNTVATELGLPADRLDAKLYKLLIYGPGGFFLPHKDSEKQNGMVASLVIVLPHSFDGGELKVAHRIHEKSHYFISASKEKSPEYVAFYADCKHEVAPVTYGTRICLTYNLVLRPEKKTSLRPTISPESGDHLADAIHKWVSKQPSNPLVFVLEHQYTQHGLQLDLLKGADRILGTLLEEAAEKSHCQLFLAQLERQWVQEAYDEWDREYDYENRRLSRRGRLQYGSTIDDTVTGKEWVDGNGKKQPWGEIQLDLAALVSAERIEDWEPTSEDYEGYTGNAGNTIDRWYHRSVVAIWHRDYHFEIIVQSRTLNCLPSFFAMVSKLGKTAKKHSDAARNDCIRFARALLKQWHYSLFGRGLVPAEKAQFQKFIRCLIELNDPELVSFFLKQLASHDHACPISAFIVSACRKFGWGTFAGELIALLTPKDDTQDRDELTAGDCEWLSAFCRAKSKDPEKAILEKNLCTLAVSRFCLPPINPWRYSRSTGEANDREKSLPHLLKAVLAADHSEELGQLIEFVQRSPKIFRLEQSQIPTLKLIFSWSKITLKKIPDRLFGWLEFTRGNLKEATKEKPLPPKDWRRAAEVNCSCPLCTELKSFLINPDQPKGRNAGPEYHRIHIKDQIARHRLDVTTELDRSKRPFALLLTKTNESFDRALKSYENNRRLLAALPKAK